MVFTIPEGLHPDLNPLAWMVGTLFFFLSLQVAVNLVSGHGALETAQAFNIHKFFYNKLCYKNQVFIKVNVIYGNILYKLNEHNYCIWT